MRSRAEEILQKAASAWLDSQGWLWCHVANERATSPRAGGQLRARGVKSGVPDILIFEEFLGPTGRRGYQGIAIELKSPKGRVSANQRSWLHSLKLRGWNTHVCRSLDDVKAVCAPLIGGD